MGMHDGIEKALGPVRNKTAQILPWGNNHRQGQEMERWVGHYSNIYSIQNIVTPQPLTPSIACRPWMSWTQSRWWKTSARPLIAWPQVKPQAAMGSPWLDKALQQHLIVSIIWSPGEKELYRRTWRTPRSLPSVRTKAREVTATTTESSPSSASSEKS